MPSNAFGDRYVCTSNQSHSAFHSTLISCINCRDIKAGIYCPGLPVKYPQSQINSRSPVYLGIPQTYIERGPSGWCRRLPDPVPNPPGAVARGHFGISKIRCRMPDNATVSFSDGPRPDIWNSRFAAATARHPRRTRRPGLPKRRPEPPPEVASDPRAGNPNTPNILAAAARLHPVRNAGEVRRYGTSLAQMVKIKRFCEPIAYVRTAGRLYVNSDTAIPRRF